MVHSHSAAAGTLPDDAQEISLRRLWGLLVRHYRLVALITLGVMAAMAYLTFRTRPSYLSTTVIRIDEDKARHNVLTDASPLAGFNGGSIATEVIVLRSYRLAAEVADSLSLHVQLLSPNLPRSQVFSGVYAPRNAAVGTFQLTREGDGSYAVSTVRAPRPVRTPARVRPGVPFRLGDASLTLHPGLARGGPHRILVGVAPFRAAVQAEQRATSVARPQPDAQIISVQYQSTDPVMAAVVPNTLTDRFIRYKARASKFESSSTVNFLRDQVAIYERELGRAEETLRRFREQAQVVSPTDEASEQVRRLAELKARRDQMETDRQALRALLARAESQRRAEGSTSAYRELAAYPTFLSNPAVQDLLRSLLQQEDQLSQLSVRKTAQADEVRAATARVGALESQLHQLAQSYLGSLDTQISSLDASLGRFGTQIEAVPAREVEFVRLSRQQKLLEDIYTLLQTRLKESEIREAAEPENVQVVDSALVPDRPFSPRPLRNMTLALVLGLMLGFTVAMAREALDTKVRTAGDVASAAGGIPVLGYIPRIQVGAAQRRALANGQLNGNGNGNGKGRGRIAVTSPVAHLESRLVARNAPRSTVSEAYRALRTSITFANVEAVPQVLVIASAMPGDGKSTSAANLAITIAQQSTRVLLVDADLRKGLLHQLLHVDIEPGLTNVLLGRATLDEAVRLVPVGEPGLELHFLPGGVLPPNPAELLGSQRMRRLMEELRAHYEVIVFDAPPLNLVTDAAVLGTLADATILVVRAGTTDKAALHHAVQQLSQLRAPVGGVVLNDFDPRGGAYYGYGYGYASSAYGIED